MLGACGSDDGGDGGEAATSESNGGTDNGTDNGSASGDRPDALRLGAFPNVTHAPALAGINEGFFEDALGDTSLEVSYFNAGGEAIEAIFSGALDITFIGPNPAINGFSESGGEAVRLIAGSTSGGASLVVREGIDSPEDLAGTTLASPALGNTQDVALRAWLADEGYETDLTGGGDVSIRPLANPDILQAFTVGELDGAWVPEPWATRLIQEADAQVLVDEADLWPNGQFVTTHVLVATEFLENHPDVVRDFLSGLLVAVDFVNADAAEAQAVVLDAIEEISGTRLPEVVIEAAWENLEFTWDPIASSLAKSAEDATEADLLDPVDLDGIYDLTILNELLADRGDPEVSDS
ncbi:MAG: ABC transporter substrate-binding protein [Acidimicrobiia bacterium]|nr:ABC transporter substrate-binding protein [Acidimicrobiia bacterium]